MLVGWWPGTRMRAAAVGAAVLFIALLLVVLLADRRSTFLDGIGTPLHEWALSDTARWHFLRRATRLGESIFGTMAYLLIGFACWTRRRIAAGAWAGLCGLGYPLLSSTVKVIVDRPRPAYADPALTFQETAFPSGHSGASMTLAIVLICVVGMSTQGWARAAVITGALAIPAVVGLSRMGLGVHYPSDVLAGFALSLVWTTTIAFAVRALVRRRLR